MDAIVLCSYVVNEQQTETDKVNKGQKEKKKGLAASYFVFAPHMHASYYNITSFYYATIKELLCCLSVCDSFKGASIESSKSCLYSIIMYHKV